MKNFSTEGARLVINDHGRLVTEGKNEKKLWCGGKKL
jgi:hypothetical protein